MGWKNWGYAKRGGVIGGVLFIIYWLSNSLICKRIVCLTELINVGGSNCLSFLNCGWMVNLIFLLIFIIIFFLFGAIIGFIIGKIKSRKSEN